MEDAMKVLRSWKLWALLVAGTCLQTTITCDPGRWDAVLTYDGNGSIIVDNGCCGDYWFNFDFFDHHRHND